MSEDPCSGRTKGLKPQGQGQGLDFKGKASRLRPRPGNSKPRPRSSFSDTGQAQGLISDHKATSNVAMVCKVTIIRKCPS